MDAKSIDTLTTFLITITVFFFLFGGMEFLALLVSKIGKNKPKDKDIASLESEIAELKGTIASMQIEMQDLALSQKIQVGTTSSEVSSVIKLKEESKQK